jgi:cytochrome oxidase Cu insertion factor (SCO1/SenC/PrrC family)
VNFTGSLLLMVSLGVLAPGMGRSAPIESSAPKYDSGRPVARVRYIDDQGRTRSLSEMAGRPLILVPMFTKCQSACPRVVDGLKRALAGSSRDVNDYRVFLFSFDATDTPESLASFRRRERVPLSWTLATADPASIHALMESISFRYATASGSLIHPNLMVVLSPDLKTGKYLFGTRHSAAELDRALDVATGRPDWLQTVAQYAFALLIFACTSSLAWLTHLLLQLRHRPATAS